MRVEIKLEEECIRFRTAIRGECQRKGMRSDEVAWRAYLVMSGLFEKGWWSEGKMDMD